MKLKARYARAMEWLYLACVVISGVALVAITLIIPAGVFMRYAMNNPLAWPEPDPPVRAEPRAGRQVLRCVDHGRIVYKDLNTACPEGPGERVTVFPTQGVERPR